MRHIPEVLMIVLKYLTGQFFFLTANFGDIKTLHARDVVESLLDALVEAAGLLPQYK